MPSGLSSTLRRRLICGPYDRGYARRAVARIAEPLRFGLGTTSRMCAARASQKSVA